MIAFSKQNWNVRFLNLPNGTTYSFTETPVPDGYDFVRADVSGTHWIANMVDGVDQGQAVNLPQPLPSNTSGSNANTDITGTIDYANARYKTTYTIETAAQKVQLKKISHKSQAALAGAEFTIYTNGGYNANPKLPAQAGLISNDSGMIDLGNLAAGTYYLLETAVPEGYEPLTEPIVLEVSADGVTARLGITDTTGLSVTGSNAAGYVAIVPNTPLETTLPIPVQKILKGRDMKAGEFAFVLQPIDIDGVRSEPLQVIYNPAGRENEAVAFNFALDYTTEDALSATYHDADGNAVFFYVVYEQQGEDADIIYLDLQYVVRFTLTQDGSELVATPLYLLYDGEGALPKDATKQDTTQMHG